MNKTLRHIILSALLLLSMAVMAQDPSQGVIVHGNVFGGGNKAPVAHKSTVLINQKNDSIAGDVYGGGALADVGTNPEDSTQVTILKGVVNGNIYGGGLGDSIGNGYFSQFGNSESVAALVYGKVFVNIGTVVFDGTKYDTIGDATLHGSVFGCNNVNGTPLDSVFVNIFRTKHIENINDYPTGINDLTALANLFPKNHADSLAYPKKFAIAAVYGGGNKASYTPLYTGDTTCTTVHVYDCQENTIHTIYGGGNAANVGRDGAPANTQLIIEGGRYDRVFGGGNGYSEGGNHNKPYKQGDDCIVTPTNEPCDDYNPGANIFGTAITDVQGGLYRQIFGGSNQFGNITTVALTIEEQNCDLLIHESFGGANEADIHGDVATTLECGDIQIGSFYGGSNLADIIDGSVTLTVKGGTYTNVFGGSKGVIGGTSADIGGDVTLNLCGGTISSAFGGSDANGKIKGIITVNLLDTVRGCPLQIDTIYGGGRDAEYAPDLDNEGKKIVSPVVNLLKGTVGHGTVKGCVFGGGKGETAVVTAHPKVIIGDTITTGSNASTHIDYQARVLGNVFGGGNAAYVDGIDSVLMLKGNSQVVNLFGGGNAAYADSAVVMMTAGTVDTIFGGGNLAGLGNETSHTEGYALVEVSDGTVQGGIYGGSNKEGTIYGDIIVNVTGGIVGANNARANIHGGGYGNLTATSGDVTVNFGQASSASEYPKLYGDLYGGSGFGHVNASTSNTTTVNVINGEITGDVYGGGLGQTSPNNYEALVNGNVEVNIGKYIGSSPTLYNHAVFNTYDSGNKGGNVFGCNNANGAPQGTVTVNVNGNVTNNVYGGGNLASYTNAGNNYPVVNINNGTVSNVFGGGLGSSAQVKGNPQVTVGEGSGSNKAKITNNVYGGGQQAPVYGNTVVLMQHANSSATKIFGGGQAASVSGTATVTVDNGTINGNTETIHNGVYGGCDNSGNVDGQITVNINNGVFGGNAANQKVYIHGGGYGSSTTTGNSVLVNVGDGTTAPAIYGDVYGGSALGAVNAANSLTKVWLKSGAINGAIYGGGMGDDNTSAIVNGDVEVLVSSGTISGNTITGTIKGAVFGGCNINGIVFGDATVEFTGGTIGAADAHANVYGGGLGVSTKVRDSVAVKVKTNSTVYGDVYGGSAKGKVNYSGDTPTTGDHVNTSVTLAGGSVTGDIYGGGHGIESAEAHVGREVVVNINSGSISTYNEGADGGNVYGCNNAAGAPQDKVTVNINSDVAKNVFGGGNLAAYTAPTGNQAYPKVFVNNGTVGGNVFGGGNGDPDDSSEATAMVTGNPEVTIGDNNTGHYAVVTHDVYGGGNAAKVTGATKVTYNDNNASSQVANLFGGGNAAGVTSTARVDMTLGNVTEGVYGGCNSKGIVGGDITVNLNGGAVGVDGTTTDVVFGGGYGHSTSTAGNIGVTLGTPANSGTAVYGNLYGGSALGSVNADANNTTTVTLTSATLHGSVFGGGMGSGSDTDHKATSLGNATVNINVHDTNLTGIYGGANVNGDVAGAINVNVNESVGATGNGNSRDIFGGGLGAVTTTGGDVTVTVGNGSTTPVIYGDVYGGSALGIVGNDDGQDTTKVAFKKGNLHGKIFGGGMGDSSDSTKVLGAVLVEITDGTIDNSIYGGCNYKGGVAGKVTINVNGGTIGSQTNLDLTPPILANVFGGGFGELTTTLGDIEVSFGTLSDAHYEFPKLYGDVYGGSALGTVNTGSSNTTSVNILNGTLVTKEGKDANDFTIYNGGNVFGGGLGETGEGNVNKGKVNGMVVVNIGKATVGTTTGPDHTQNIYSGSAVIGGCVYGCNNTNGSPQDMVTVNVYKTHHDEKNAATYQQDDATYAIANVFGGGNLANYTASDKTATVNIFSCDNTIGRTFGGGNAAATPNVETQIKGGRIGQVFGGGNGEVSAADINGTVDLGIHGGNVGQTFGGSNTSGNISGEITIVVDETGCGSLNIDEFFCGGNFANIYGGLTTDITCSQGMSVKNIYGGCNMADIYGDVVLNLYGGVFEENVFGGSKGRLADNTVNPPISAKAANILKYPSDWETNTNYPPALKTYMQQNGGNNLVGTGGNVTLNLYGGTMTNAFGGSNVNGNIEGVITVNVLDNGGTCGLEVHNIYGGSNVTAYTPNYDLPSGVTERVSPVVNLIHGTVSTITDPNTGVVTGGNVYGGSKGGNNVNATVTASPKVTIGYDATTMGTLYSQLTQNNTNYTSTTQPTAFHAVVGGNVYGGGDLAAVAGSTSVTLQESNSSALSLFGGGNKANVGGATVNVLDGSVSTGVYGGCNEEGTVSGDIAVNVKSNLGTQSNPLAEGIYGGGKGNATQTTGDVTVTIDKLNSGATAPVLYSDVYGGSAFGQVSSASNLTKVDLKAGTINGVLYGGGMGCVVDANHSTAYSAQVSGNTQVSVNGSVTGGVYGGCNINGIVSGNSTVGITDGTIGHITNGSDVYGAVYGGGLGENTKVKGNVIVNVNGASITGDVYGGSAQGLVNCNDSGNGVNGSANTQVILTNGSITGNLYGGGHGLGSKEAHVWGPVTVNVDGGTVNNIFGCNNAAGAPQSTVKVNINSSVVENVYGGGNLAAYSYTGNYPEVNINNGTIANVFGGGLGATAVVTGNPQVTIGDNSNGSTYAMVTGNVYGGGDAAKVVGNTTVVYNDSHTSSQVAKLFGGSNAANIEVNPNVSGTGKTNVTLTNGKVTGGLYGGCNTSGTVGGDITVLVEGGQVGTSETTADVFGGGYGNNTATEGNVEVNLNGSSAIVWGDIYGGSAEGNVNKVNNNNTTTVNVLNGTVKRDIYGGGLGTGDHAAAVNGAVIVNIGSDVNTGDAILNGNVYGCNNTNGSPQDNVTVNIYKTNREASQETTGTGFAIANVFGGGNKAAYSPAGNQTVSVIIHGCSNTIEDVFGGGDAAAVKKASVEVNGGRFNRVFAGGNGEVTAANIGTGGTSLLVKAGKIHQLFGGSNERGIIEGPITVTLNHENSTCTEEIDEFFGGSNLAGIGTNDNPATLSTTIACGVGTITDVYGGSNAADIIGNVTLNIEGGSITNAYGGSKGVTNGTAANIKDARDNENQPLGTHGKVTLNLFGGEITNAFGGSNLNGNIEGKITVNMLNKEASNCGLIVHNIYGASNLAAYTPNSSALVSPEVNLFHGTVSTYQEGGVTKGGNVFGGAKGGSGATATVTANPQVTIGYNDGMTLPVGVTSISTSQVTVAGNVYGGGDEAPVNGGTSITMQRKASTDSYTSAVSGNVYGGGNKANVSGSTTVNVTGGTVTEDAYGGGALANVGSSSVALGGGTVRTLYGGGMGNTTTAALVNGDAQVTVNSGTINGTVIDNTTNLKGGVFGGCNVKGAVLGEAEVYVNGAVGTGTNRVNVYGGGLGQNTNVVGAVAVTVGQTGTPTIYGDVYGGSAKGLVNYSNETTPAANGNTTTVTLTNGTVTGDIYGGGHGLDNQLANVGGPVTVAINGGSVSSYGTSNANGGNVFGCNNLKGAPQNTVTVNVSSNVATNVYGGGNEAAYTNSNNYPAVNILKGTVTGSVFGGGKGSGATVSGGPTVIVGDAAHAYTATVGTNVYGGGDLAAVNGSTSVTVQQNSGTGANTAISGNVYGGGNQANVSGSTEVVMTGGTVTEDVYGGGALAHVNINEGTTPPSTTTGATTSVSMSGGSVRTVYGGGMGDDANNGAAALVYGNTTVTVSDGVIGGTNINTDANPILGGVFGGCNKRGTVLGGVTVNVKGAVGSESNSKHINVYGGGLGQNTNVVGAVAVGVGANVFGDVYGGSAKGLVNYSNETTPAANSNTTTVTLTSGVVTGDIYGGGHGLDDQSANVGGPVTVAINGGSVSAYGTNNTKGGSVFGCNNVKGSPIDTVNVNITAGNMQNVFGGGNMANKTGKGVAVTYNTTSTTSQIDSQIDTIFGGGNMAGVAGNAKVIMANGKVNKGIYGGCNAQGTVGGDVIVDVTGGTIGASNARAYIHGGGYGNETATSGDVMVNFGEAASATTPHTVFPELYGDIYGGSGYGNVNGASSDSTIVNILNGEITGDVYGGGLGRKGSTTPAITAYEAKVNGKVFVNIGQHVVSGDTVGMVMFKTYDNGNKGGNVFGCNNANGSPQDSVFVHVWKTDQSNGTGFDENGYAIANVFGGGNEADYAPENNSSTSDKRTLTHIHGCDNTVRRVFGGGNAAAAVGVITTIDGGRFNEIFGGGNGEVSAANIGLGGDSLTIRGGKIGRFFGGSNSQGEILGPLKVNVTEGECGLDIDEFFCGSNKVDIAGDVITTIECGSGTANMHITSLYGGSNKADIGGQVSLTVEGGHFTNVFGGSKGTLDDDDTPGVVDPISANIGGNVTLNLYGGTITNAFGGSNVLGKIGGIITVNVDNRGTGDCALQVDTIYGAGQDAAYAPDSILIAGAKVPPIAPRVNVLHGTVGHGTVKGCVFGGGKGETAVVTANPKVVIGDNDNSHTAIVLGNVFSGGNAAAVDGIDSVLIQKASSRVSNVFGGGNEAVVKGSTMVIMDNGTADTIFGGGNKAGLTKEMGGDGAAFVKVNSGTVKGGVYGGCNTSGDVAGLITVEVNDGIVGANETNGHANVHGGGYGQNTTSSDDVTVVIGNGTSTPTIWGDVYGGSALGAVNATAASPADTVMVWLKSGTINGDLYGGGLGKKPTGNNPSTGIAAAVNGAVKVLVNGGTVNGRVFGCNNANGAPQQAVRVDIDKNIDAWSINDVFGGGNEAAFAGITTVNIKNGTVANVYGGGNQAGVGIDTVNILGGTVTSGVYGGCNTSGTVTGDITVNLAGGTVGANTNSGRADVYGGGFGQGTSTSGDVKVTLTNTTIYGDLYGGSAFGSVNGTAADTTKLTIGGSNLYGTVYGGGKGQDTPSPITATTNGKVIVDYNTANALTGLYGGANVNGLVGGDIHVNVNANVGAENDRIDIFGGGLGQNTNTSGDVNVNIGSTTSTPIIYGDIYGGSALGNVNDKDNVGRDSTFVNILNGNLYGDVYGGGLGDKTNDIKAKVYGKVFVKIGTESFGQAALNTYASGTKGGNVYGCNNLNGSPMDSVFVNVYQTAHGNTYQTNKYPDAPTGGWSIVALAENSENQSYAIQSVYGGGNQASYTPTETSDNKSKSTTVHLYNCANTVKEVYGGGNAANVGSDAVNANTFIYIDGGRINRVFGGGKGVSGGVAANIYGKATTTVYAGLIDSIFGGSNQNGTINEANLVLATESGSTCSDKLYNQVFGGANVAEISGNLNTTINCGVGTIGDIYGGSNLADITGTGNVTLNIKGGTYNNVFGGSRGAEGDGNGADISGNVTLNLVGGTMTNAFGGSNVQGNIAGKITVNVIDTVSCTLVVDTIYGGGQKANYTPALVAGKKIVSPVVNLLNGTVGHGTGCVFGGGKEASVTAHPKVVIGDTRTGNESYVAQVLGNVFGGGNLATVDGIDSVLMLKGNSQVVNLFGGGNRADADSTVVMMTAGTVDTIFGGGNMAGLAGAAKVALSGGKVNKGVYGGCNASGTVTGDIVVNVDGGNVGASGIEANVHGGGFGQPTQSASNVEVTIGNGVGGPTIYGDVYGGSALGTVNNTTAAVNSSKHTYVTLNKGTVHGDLYGGGLGEKTNTTDIPAKVWSPVTVNIYGGTVANVFGCNNENGAPQSTVLVNVSDTTKAHSMSVTNVFGGGNLAQYSGAPQVNILNGTVSGNVFGGGKGELASGNDRGVKGKVTGNPQVTIGDDVMGHTAHVTGDVYGGGDAANVDGTPVVVVNDCNTTIGYLYGGGNAADVKGTNITVNAGTITHQAFGGGHGDKTVTVEPLKYADVNGHVVFNVYGGTIAQVFAGSNSKGAITGTTGLTINKTNDACAMKIGEVYGGGNEADGNAGTITIGCTGTWTNSHDTHNSTNNRIGYELEGIGTVYGGANQANVGNDIELTINSGIVENVFGGNNLDGTISGSIQVEIDSTAGSNTCGWYVGNVYGGGNQAAYGTGNNYPVVNIKNGLVSGDVFGGGLGLSSDPTKGKVTGNPQVTVNAAKARVNGGVYGGGSLAPTEGNPLVTQTLGATAKVFGGGKAANVVGAPTVNINGGTVSTGVYGGCDSQGDVSGNIIVNITNGTIGTDATHRADIHGGGYGAGTSTQGDVTVNFGEAADATTAHTEYPIIFGDVYGGSALGSVNKDKANTTMVNIMNGTLKTNSSTDTTVNHHAYFIYAGGNVFGGGLGEEGNTEKGKVNGRVVVNIGAAPTKSGRDLHPENDDLIGQARIEGNVYGCNNTSGSPQDSVTVNIYRTLMRSTDTVTYSGNDATYAINNVFGGGNKANYVPATTATNKKLKVMVHGCFNTIDRVFGGSNAAAAGATENTVKVVTDINGGRFNEVFGGGNGEVSAADIYGDVDLGIHGGIVNEFYVGSNNSGTIYGDSDVKVDQTGGCEEISITEFFCGGKYADFHGNINATITCSDGMTVNNLYGGCKEAHVVEPGNITLTVYGGTYDNIYGGSKGTPEVGADVHGNITLNIYGGTVHNAIFGGSNVKGDVKGKIQVNVENRPTGNCSLDISEADVYGGGNKADYKPTNANTDDYPEVNIKYATVKNVFGGGLQAEVKGNPHINIKKGSKILGNVYGGGNMGKVTGNPSVIINGKQTN